MKIPFYRLSKSVIPLRRFSFCLVLLAWPLPGHGQVENGDFSDWISDVQPNKWNVGINPPSEKENVVVEAIDEDGVSGLKVGITSNNGELHLSQSARNFRAGGKYRLSFEFKKAAWNIGYARITFEAGSGRANLKVMDAFGKEDLNSDSWQRLQSEFVIPPDAELERWLLQFRFIGQGEFFIRKIEIDEAG